MNLCEWQLTDPPSGWVFGLKVRGVVRIPLGSIYFDEDSVSPEGGWTWMVHEKTPKERASPKGLALCMEDAMAEVEKALGLSVEFEDMRPEQESADAGTECDEPRRAWTQYRRRVIRIAAKDSPNVKRALCQLEKGLPPDGRTVLPGVLDWETYQRRRKEWDAQMQCTGLDAEFWKGAP